MSSSTTRGNPFSTRKSFCSCFVVRARVRDVLALPAHAVSACTFEIVRQHTDNTDGEDDFDQMDALLLGILGSQFAFFTEYGLLPLNTCRLLNRHPDNPGKAWRLSAKYYSEMSVGSKTLLIILSSVYAKQVPAIYDDEHRC